MKKIFGGSTVEIKKAEIIDLEKIINFYHLLIDEMIDSKYEIGWKKNIYSTQDFLSESISEGNLYFGLIENEIASCMIINNKFNKSYKKFSGWKVNAATKKILVIHALGVSKKFSGKGIAKEMVNYAINFARLKNCNSMRLDVLSGNIPAEKLYSGLGFEHLTTIKMFYEDTGWTDYKLFEKVL